MPSFETTRPLRKGFTTGVHAVAAFRMALEAFVVTGKRVVITTEKMDNDDLDVTKGCEIVVTLSSTKEDLHLNTTPHPPYRIGTLELYAGVGVGVVIRDGLKPPKGFPAINPVPLDTMMQVAAGYAARMASPVYATISVTDGEALARQTANAKVGVIGGISILGTTGWVKPVSSDAYLDSIRAEIGVAAVNGYGTIALTIGNTSLAVAKEHFEAMQIVEMGNFVHDTLAIVAESPIKNVEIVCGIAKAVKIAQGFRNTHNRFGSIDFDALTARIDTTLGIPIDPSEIRTVKHIVTQLGDQVVSTLTEMVREDAAAQLMAWFPDLDVRLRIV